MVLGCHHNSLQDARAKGESIVVDLPYESDIVLSWLGHLLAAFIGLERSEPVLTGSRSHSGICIFATLPKVLLLFRWA